MKRKIVVLLFLATFFVLTLLSCSKNTETGYTPIICKTSKGNFQKSESDTIIEEYSKKTDENFFVSLDFDLTEGKVDWEIVNPNGEIVYKGYVTNEQGTLYGQLTSPQDTALTGLADRFYKKEEIKRKPTYSILSIMKSDPGMYKLRLKPTNAQGKYKVDWSSRLPSD